MAELIDNCLECCLCSGETENCTGAICDAWSCDRWNSFEGIRMFVKKVEKYK